MRFALVAAVFTLFLLSAATAQANSPAPWWACDGKAAGGACESYGGADGFCVPQAECADNPATEVDECLICVARPSSCSVVSGPAALAGSGWLLLGAAAFTLRRRSRSS